jgi:hypothetical protein
MLILPQLPDRFYRKPEFIEIFTSWILTLGVKIAEKHLKKPNKMQEIPYKAIRVGS